MYFPSRRDAWLGILLWGVVANGLYFSFQDPERTGLYIAIPLLVLVTWVWFFTGYTLTDDYLYVRCGPFRKKVALEDIIRIRESRKFLASAALSMERLEIHTENRYPYIISPREKEEFIKQILSRQPDIKVEKKNKGGKTKTLKKRPTRQKRRQ